MITRQLDNAEDRFAAIADYRDTDSGATDAVFAHSNARRAGKIWEHTGSQQPQLPGDARPQPAFISAAKRLSDRHRATRRDPAEVPSNHPTASPSSGTRVHTAPCQRKSKFNFRRHPGSQGRLPGRTGSPSRCSSSSLCAPRAVVVSPDWGRWRGRSPRWPSDQHHSVADRASTAAGRTMPGLAHGRVSGVAQEPDFGKRLPGGLREVGFSAPQVAATVPGSGSESVNYTHPAEGLSSASPAH
jgi:hypothetical protein